MPLRRYRMNAAHVLFIVMITCLAAPLAMTVRASAQGTAGTLPDPITSREIDTYSEMLGLSDEQLLRVTSFHEQYLEDFKKLRESRIEDFLEEIRGIRPTVLFGECETVKDLADQLKKLTRDIAATDRRLFDRMQTVLTESQLVELPRVRQTRQRERALDGATRWVSYLNQSTRADFSELVDEIEIDSEQIDAIDPTLRRYEQRLTSLLEELSEATRNMFVNLCENISEQGLTPQALAEARAEDRAEDMMSTVRAAWSEASESTRKIAGEISALNRRTLDEMMQLLNDPTADDLRERFLLRAYRETRDRDLNARRHLETALESEKVTGEARASVESIMQQFRRQDRNVTDQMMDVIDEMRTDGSPFRFMRNNDDEHMRALRDQLEELEQQRQSINDRAVASLQALLGEDLTDALAQQSASRREQRGDRPRRGPRGGGGGGDDSEDDESGGPDGATAAQDRFVPAPITTADVNDYVEYLSLGDNSASIAQSLHDEYMAGYREVLENDLTTIEELEDEMPGFRGRGRETTMTNEKIDRIYELRKQAFERVAQLDERLFDDLGLLVVQDEAAAAIEQLRNARKRERYMPRDEDRPRVFMGPGARSRGTGAVVDLTQLIDENLDLDAEQQTALAETLHQYEMNLSDQLAEHFQTRLAMWKLNAKFRLMISQSEGGRGWREAQEKYGDMFDMVGERLGNAMESIAQLNRNTMQTLRSQLPDPAAQSLQDAYNRRAYPDIFDEDRSAEPVIQAALGLTDLTDDQRNRLIGIATSYRQRYRDITNQLIELRRNTDAGADRNWRNNMERRNQRRALEFERRELTSITMRKIRATLRDEQVERIPPLREDDET